MPNRAPRPDRERGPGQWLLPALAWAGCVAYAGWQLRHGWVAHDAGALGESAQRVLAGQLPHRDFDAIYTGGLSVLHAAAFRVLGTSALTMRLVLLVAFALWLPAVYAIARRVARWPAALAATMLAAGWSIPVYPESMPSWYNLFLATAGTLALLHAFETRRSRWLFAAGVCAALSCLVKITGLYFLCAALLAIAWHEQTRLSEHTHPSGDRIGSWVVTGAGAAFVLALVALVRRDASAAVALHFVLPGAALTALLVRREWRSPPAPWRRRLRTASALGGPFAAGVVLPVALFIAPYAASGSMGALARGIFVLPFRRLDYARVQPFGTVAFLLLAGAAAVAPRVARGVSRFTRYAVLALVVGLLLAAPIAATGPVSYVLMWLPMRLLVPLVVTWGVVRMVRRDGGADPHADERLYLLLASAAMCSLIQFPFAEPVYLFYVAPLAVLAALALVANSGTITRRLAAITAISYLAFAVLRIHPASVFTMGYRYRPDDQHASLALPRGGIDVSPQDSATYDVLVRLLRAHSPSGYTYATPDCPQVYFLSGLRNPTRTLFDFFDDPAGRTTRILHELAQHRVTAVAVNTTRLFSGPVPGDLLAALTSRYPNRTRVGTFIVLWR